MSEQDWGVVLAWFAIAVALLAVYIATFVKLGGRGRHQPEREVKSELVFVDRKRCAVHGGPIADGDREPVEVHMKLELFNTEPIPVTMFICQDCASRQAYGSVPHGG